MESFNPRIKKVLDKLVEPNFKLKDDAYLNLLLTHLTTEEKGDGQVTRQTMVNKHLLLDWLVDVIIKWAKTQNFPKPHILAFVMNLLKSFCVNENIFVRLKSENVFEYLLEMSNYAMSPSPQPNVELALVKLLYSSMDHEAGLQWIISENRWEIVLNSALNSHTVYISKEGCKFIARFLVATTPRHSTMCRNIIQLILTPLIESSNRVAAGDGVAGAIDGTFCKSLSPTLQLIIEILLRSLENQVCSNEKELILTVTEQFNLEKCVQKLISKTDNEDFLHDLYKILIVLCFFDMHFKSYNKKTIVSGQIDTAIKLFDVIYDAVSKGPVTLVLKIIFTSLDYWEIMEKTSPVWVSPKHIALSFKDQLLVLQLLPAIPFSIERMKYDLNHYDEDEFQTLFAQKIVDHIIPMTMRIGYKWRPYILQNDSLSYGTMAMKYFLHSKKYYKRENAIFSFQILTNILIDINGYMETHPDSIMYFLRQHEYFTLLLESITVVIEEFSITWKDTIEILCVLQTLYNFLNTFTWPSRVLVKGLKLADVAISRYMSPSMALLIDDIDNNIAPFARMLHVKLHDGEWEVRDSAIELICTLARTANTKFSSFRKPVTENDFPCAILNMALVDGNSFVRATAFKCLQEMIQVDEFWQILLTKGNILEKSLEVLHIEPEGIVRTEVAILIHYMFRYQDIPKNILDKFYDVMTHAVVADLHWEVRVKALHFWKTIIDHHLTQQGMIDGTFPSFTFSKEHRKIVNLKEDQIKKNLIKVLYQLSLTGCLAVFRTALLDQCDIEVSKYAKDTINDFVTLLKQYKITSSELASGTSDSVNSHQKNLFDTPSTTCVSSEISSHSMKNMLPNEISINADEVMDDLLEEILDSQDINLLQSVFNTLDQPTHDYIEMKSRTVLPPMEFVNFVYSNCESCTNEKEKWVERIDNFNSLLDDILKEYDTDDINSMDCY